MIDTTDKYLMKLNSICRQCKNKNNEIPHSCKAYPERDSVPTDIWNARITECKYFEPKHPK